MSGWFQNLLKDTANGFFGAGAEYIRDYTHASKAFGQNLYQYAPKFKYLFHCYFNINNNVYDIDGNPASQQNYGILVRDVKLPSYTIQTAQMNQYNRKRIITTKIKYDPVNFTFYDDNSNTMAKLWAAYYTYYFYDGSNPNVFVGNARGNKGQDLGSVVGEGSVRGLGGRTGAAGETAAKYNSRDIYDSFVTGQTKWGYIGESSNGAKIPFFNNITIYGFYQHSFISYTLINPVITNFAHDTYDYEQGTGIMKNSMTIDYETVVYNEGAMAGDAPSGGGLVPGFAEEGYYDRRVSPIASPGSNNNILGKGGLVDAVNGFTKNIGSNPFKAIKQAGAAYKTFKNVNIVQTLKNDLKASFLDNLRSKPNETRNLSFNFANPNTTQAPPPGQPNGVGSVSQTPTTDQTKGTSDSLTSDSPRVVRPDVITTQVFPAPVPAGTQSGTTSGNLPPTPPPRG